MAQLAVFRLARLLFDLVLHEERWQLIIFVAANETEVDCTHRIQDLGIEAAVVTRGQVVSRHRVARVVRLVDLLVLTLRLFVLWLDTLHLGFFLSREITIIIFCQ